MDIISILAPLFIYAIVPLIALAITVFIFGLQKNGWRKISLLSALALIASLVAYGLSQLYLPLAWISAPLLMFLGFRFLAKSSIPKSIGATLLYTAIDYILQLATVFVLLSIDFS